MRRAATLAIIIHDSLALIQPLRHCMKVSSSGLRLFLKWISLNSFEDFAWLDDEGPDSPSAFLIGKEVALPIIEVGSCATIFGSEAFLTAVS